MPNDPFASRGDSANHPSRAPFPIVPSDTAPLPVLPKAIYVGVGGSVCLRGIEAAGDVTFVNVAAGSVLDVRASHVRAQGTTAGSLIGLA